MKQVSGQMSLFDLDMPCGRTSPAHSLPTKAKTSVSSSKSFAKSKTKAPMFLDLSGGGGNLVGVSWETDIPWHGASSMLNFGESPNVVEESGLSQILEDNVPQRYYLSARACVGVLRRAERRGKELKPILKLALEQQIERWRKYGSPLPVFDVDVVCIDGVENKAFSIDPLSSNSMKSNNPHSGFHETSIAKCLDTSDGSPNKNQGGTVIVQGYADNSSGDGISGTIDAHYYLGCGARGGKEREFVACCYQKVVGALCVADSKQVGNQYVSDGKLIVEASSGQVEYQTHDFLVRMREGKDGGGKGALVQEDKSGTIACNNDQVLIQHAQTQYIVRRLTPLECCRLQGMPDWWCADIPHSDAQEYRMWGNGMALPNALYIMEGLAKSEE